MKTLNITGLLLALLLVISIFSGCAGIDTNDEAAEFEDSKKVISVMDMKGRQISLNAPAERVIALTASDCEILYAIGAGNTLVGRGEYCDYPEEAMSVPTVQSGSETNIEQIIALEPQVVVMSTMAQTKEQIQALENAGITVVVSNPSNIQEVYTAIELIGTIVGKKDESNMLIENMQTQFSSIEKKSTGDGSQTIYFEVSPLEHELWTAGSGTFMDEIATMLGLRNIFADVENWAKISQEQVIERNPDYIVTITMYFGEGMTPEAEIANREGWGDITAVKNETIYNADSNEISRPGPRLVEAANGLYKFIYGSDSIEDSAA